MNKIERDKGKRQTNFMRGRSTLDHILPLRTFLDQVLFFLSMSLLLFCWFQKNTFNIVPCDKHWEHFQHLGVPLLLQQVLKAMYSTLNAKVRITSDTCLWWSHVQHWFSPTPFNIYIDKLETFLNEIDMDWSPCVIHHIGYYPSIRRWCSLAFQIKSMLTKTLKHVLWVFNFIYLRPNSWSLLKQKEIN